MTRPEDVNDALPKCPECGTPGKPCKRPSPDGTRIYKCPDCTRIGIGCDDSTYEYPLWFDKEGRKYL